MTQKTDPDLPQILRWLTSLGLTVQAVNPDGTLLVRLPETRQTSKCK